MSQDPDKSYTPLLKRVEPEERFVKLSDAEVIAALRDSNQENEHIGLEVSRLMLDYSDNYEAYCEKYGFTDEVLHFINGKPGEVEPPSPIEALAMGVFEECLTAQMRNELRRLGPE